MTDVEHFVEPIADFYKKPAPFMVEAFAWYLHEVKRKDRFSTADIGACFDEAHITRPGNIAAVIAKLVAKKPPRVIRDTSGFRLHADTRRQLGTLLPVRATSVKTTRVLNDLLAKVTDPAQKAFLNEALVCFKNQAYRASIVMAWNLAFSDVLDRILKSHLAAFNAQVGSHGFKHAITTRVDFELLKESQIITIARAAHVIGKETIKTLEEKLNKRNTAAHPSSVTVGAPTAEEVIFDLVENILLKPTL